MKKRNTPFKQDSMVPLPPELRDLPALVAEPWFQVSPDPSFFLEGPAFDQEGNLFVTSPPNGIVFKVTPRKKPAPFLTIKAWWLTALPFIRTGGYLWSA